ncbi:MAG TPA: hypothetical protein VGG19_06095 [Tepidisphaeraceae bacterium]
MQKGTEVKGMDGHPILKRLKCYCMTKLLKEAVAKAGALPKEKQDEIAQLVLHEIESRQNRPLPHSVLDIAPVSLGKMISLPGRDDDLLGEMLEDRR